jgi:hypothetical protein
LQQRLEECGHLGDHMLTVVNHDQQRATAEVRDERVYRRHADAMSFARFSNAERARHCRGDAASVRDRRKFDRPRSVGGVAGERRRRFKGEPGLPGPPWAHQRHQTRDRHQVPQLRQLLLAPDEAGKGSPKIAGRLAVLPGSCSRSFYRWVVGQHRCFQASQLWPWL